MHIKISLNKNQKDLSLYECWRRTPQNLQHNPQTPGVQQPQQNLHLMPRFSLMLYGICVTDRRHEQCVRLQHHHSLCSFVLHQDPLWGNTSKIRWMSLLCSSTFIQSARLTFQESTDVSSCSASGNSTLIGSSTSCTCWWSAHIYNRRHFFGCGWNTCRW